MWKKRWAEAEERCVQKGRKGLTRKRLEDKAKFCERNSDKVDPNKERKETRKHWVKNVGRGKKQG